MDVLKYVTQDKPSQRWIETFSEGLYEESVNANPFDCIDDLAKTPVDLILFDCDHKEMSIDIFLGNLQNRYLYIPVLMVSGDIKELPSLQKKYPELIGQLPKPFSEVDFKKITKLSLAAYRAELEKEFSKGRSVGNYKEALFIVGYRTNAIVYKVSKNGMVLILPIAIQDQTRILFKAQPLFKRLGLQADKFDRIELQSVSCSPTPQNQFKVTAEFVKAAEIPIKKNLDHYINQFAGKCSVLSPGTQNILIGGDNESIWQTYRFHLQGSDSRLFFAKNGNEILEILQHQAIDLLIVDTDDLQQYQNLLLDDLQKIRFRIPILVATNEQDPNLIRKITPLIKGLILKPFSSKDLIKHMDIAKDRWQEELRWEEEIGDNIGLYFNTRILLAYRDTIIIDRIRKDGMVCYKKLPIVPSATFYFNAQTLFRSFGINIQEITPIQLTIIRCERDLKNNQYRILAKFVELDTLQMYIDAYVDGKELSEVEINNNEELQITETEVNQVEQDEGVLLDDFFSGFDEDYSFPEEKMTP